MNINSYKNRVNCLPLYFQPLLMVMNHKKPTHTRTMTMYITVLLSVLSIGIGRLSMLCAQENEHQYAPIVQLITGKVVGLVEKDSVHQKNVYFYQGIRYG